MTFRVTFPRYDEALWSFSPSAWPSLPHIAPSAAQNTTQHQLAFRAGGSQEQVSLCVRKKNWYNNLYRYVNTFISMVRRKEIEKINAKVYELMLSLVIKPWKYSEIQLDALLLDFEVSRLFHSLKTIFNRVGSRLLILVFQHITCIYYVPSIVIINQYPFFLPVYLLRSTF